MSLLYRSLTIDRLWALLEAHAPFAAIIASSRRVKDTEEGWLKRLVLRSVGDFPHVDIQMGDNFGGGAIPMQTLAAESSTFGTASGDMWVEARNSDFKISIVYEKPGFDKQDELEMTLLEAIEGGGRSLGYTPIKSWGPWKAKRNASTTIPGEETLRPVTQITLPVTYEFAGSQLKP